MKPSANIKIESLPYPVHIGFNLWHEIEKFLHPFQTAGKIYFLTDENTNRLCLRVLNDHISLSDDQPLFTISPGEQSKDIANLDRIWNWLVKSGAGKDSLLVNLGGGVVSDLGGFAAGTFNRGMQYVNIPTSLTAMADAAIGGKTGINISGIKNQAGLFYDPAAVFINPVFLETLPEIHFKSGFAEIIKSAALSGDRFWELMKKGGKPDHDHIFRLIFESVNFKCHVVSEDPFDRSTRKMLNFGHTVGHALESISILPGEEVMHHGQAVASGMICEAWLSNKIAGLGADEMMQLVSVIKSYFDLKPVGENHFNQLAETVNYDKKKAGGGIGFSLLEGLGKHSPGKFVNKSDLFNSFRFYNEIIQKR